MPSNTAAPAVPEQTERGSTEELIERGAQDSRALVDGEVDQLTDYFLGESRQRPGEARSETKDLAVNLAIRGEPREWKCTIRSITWEEWQQAQRTGTDSQRGQEQINQFKRGSYTVAYALVKPDLGKVRAALPEKQRPVDTAEMLRDFFRAQPGSLIDLEAEVLKLSRLSVMESAVREIEAAGN